jgi:hypothetical protein
MRSQRVSSESLIDARDMVEQGFAVKVKEARLSYLKYGVKTH